MRRSEPLVLKDQALLSAIVVILMLPHKVTYDKVANFFQPVYVKHCSEQHSLMPFLRKAFLKHEKWVSFGTVVPLVRFWSLPGLPQAASGQGCHEGKETLETKRETIKKKLMC